MPFRPIETPPPRLRSTGPFGPLAADINMLSAGLQEVDARTRALEPQTSATVRPHMTPNGTLFTAAGESTPARAQRLPFELFARLVPSETEEGEMDLQLAAAAGTIATFSKTETVETAPADGTWYFYTSATVDATTGAITETGAEWSNSTLSNTATVYYALMGEIVIADGEIDGPIVQYTYGPMAAVVHGGVSNTWEVYLI